MRKNILKILTLFVFLIGCLTNPINTQAASVTKISGDYTMGNSKYYFVNSVSNESIIYFCKADKNGRNETILCKVNAREINDPEYMEINGYYENKFYYTIIHYSADSFFGYIDLKKKQIKITEYPGVDRKISNSQYILSTAGSLGAECILPVYAFDAKKNRSTLISKYCVSMRVHGNNLYFIQTTSDEIDNARSTTIGKFNLKSNKTTTLAKNLTKDLLLSAVSEINKDYVAYTTASNTFKIIEFGKGKKVVPKDGELYISVRRKYGIQKPDCYALHIKGNTLTLYGSYKTKGKNDAKKTGMYKFTLSPTYKIGLYEDGDIEYTNASRFNKFFDDKNFENGGILTVKNGKVTEILMYP